VPVAVGPQPVDVAVHEPLAHPAGLGISQAG
jgi:hypothetical protein